VFDLIKVASASLAREGLIVGVIVVVQTVLLAASVGAFAFLLSSLWATLKVTFVGLPESTPEPEMDETPSER
jgi:hypothetical protein